jgi:uroporphyrinogen-III synthase
MRVLVTRPELDAQRTAERLAAHGHVAVVAPFLRIGQTGARPPAGQFDAIVLTSANAVPALAALDPDARALPVFAVGARTAAAAMQAGFCNVTAAEGDAASLVHVVTKALPRGARLLRVAGRDRKAEPEASLSDAPFAITTWVAYEAVAVPRLPEPAEHALREMRLDAALHYSRRSAAVALRLVEDAGLAQLFLALSHICLSPDAALPLQEAGAPRVRIAECPAEEAMLALIDAWAAEFAIAGSQRPRPGC